MKCDAAGTLFMILYVALWIAIQCVSFTVPCDATPALLDYIDTPNGDGSRLFISYPSHWWIDDSGIIHDTQEWFKPSDGVWDIENTSAPHHVYAATDEVRWRVDPPSGEAAGFEITFSTVSLYLFDEVNGDVEKTINWERSPLATSYDGSAITFPLFNNVSLYVISTPEGYKSNFLISNPAQIPDPSSVDYFGASVELSKVYFAVRYSVSKWPDSTMRVDGTEYGPGAIIDGYSATFGDDLWMLPTHCYRNVSGFDGVNWNSADDESYVYYIFDRLAQEILVLAPYTLFVGAQNVVIDPTTWTGGHTGSDSITSIDANNPTTTWGTDQYVYAGGGASSGVFSGLYKFYNLPSSANCSDVSATFTARYYNSSGTFSLPSTNNVRRLIQPWVETEATHNVYSTGNNWNTAGAGGSGTDYDQTISISFAYNADLAISNNSTFNSWCQSWINGSVSNNGFLILGTSGAAYYSRWFSDDYATSGARPYLAITYTPSLGSLPSLPSDTTDVNVINGSLNVSMTIADATTGTVYASTLVNEVSGDVLWEDGTHETFGTGADNAWDSYYDTALIGGGTSFILTSNYSITQPGIFNLYFLSSDTGYEETRTYPIQPSGSTSAISDASAALDAMIRYKPSDTAYPIVGYPTTEIGTLYVPSGVYLQEDASLEILATFDVEGVTPDMELVVGNDADNGLVSFNARDSYHVTGWTFSRTSSPNIDGTTEYVFRMRYEVPSSAITASGTGTLRIEGSYFNPQLGVQQIHNTVAMYARSIDANEADTLTSGLSTVDTSLSEINTKFKAVEADAVYTVFTDTEIDGATSTYNASPGYCYVPATYPAMYAKVDDTSGVTDTIKLVFLHWVNMGSVSTPIYTLGGKFEVDPGTWTVSDSGVVTSATIADILKSTGQATSILQYNEGGF